LAELGIELPEPTAPGNPAEPQTGATAPVDASVAPNPAPQQGVAESSHTPEAFRDIIQRADGDVRGIYQELQERGLHKDIQTFCIWAKHQGIADIYDAIKLAEKVGLEVDDENEMAYEGYLAAKELLGQPGFAEGDNMATFESINAMRKAAGLPIKENAMLDESGNTWDHLLDRFRHEVEQFKAGGELDHDLYDALFDYYSHHGAMPYGVAKARTGDPFNWVSHRLGQDLGLDENLIAPMAMPVATEGCGCNHTMEGEYCPEHGLAECGMDMSAGLMGETLDKPPHDDPMNYNAAMTGSYYESKDGDAMLARIKSLALLK
jgi:hypothetical protein